MKRDAKELLGRVVIHKTFGEVKVNNVYNNKEDVMINGCVMKQKINKTFVLSNAFFYGLEDYCDLVDEYIVELKGLRRKPKHGIIRSSSKKRKGIYIEEEYENNNSYYNFNEFNDNFDEHPTTYYCMDCKQSFVSHLDYSACPECGSENLFEC